MIGEKKFIEPIVNLPDNDDGTVLYIDDFKTELLTDWQATMRAIDQARRDSV